MDKECIKLCHALNMLPGIKTFESCCGHGNSEYSIYFLAKSLKDLPQLVFWFDICHCGFYDWKIIAKTDCAMSPVSFVIKGPIGNEAYEQSEQIAKLIEEDEKIRREL